ncbi:MAG: tetratricopeptide repeat protein [Alistipes sp.]
MCRKLIFILILLVGLSATSGVRAADPETRAWIVRGVSLFDFGRWSDARHELLRAQAALAPTDRYERQQVDFYLAACAVELGSADAEAALERFNEQWGASTFGNDVQFSLASLYCARGEMSAAASAFAAVDYTLLNAHRREQYDLRMGYVAFSAGRYDEAYKYFDRVASRSEYADHALYYKSYIEYARGHYAQAKQGFNLLASSAAYAPLVPYYLLQLEFMEGNYRYVVEQGDALAAKAVTQHRLELERVMAESWYHLGDFERTIRYLAAFGRDGGEFSRNEEYLMGYSLYRTARYADAEAYLRRACGSDDALTQNASYHLADCYVRRDAKRDAMQSFAMAANESFDAIIAEDALFNYGKLQYDLGGGVFNEAINVLTRYLERYPASSRAPEARELLIAAYYNSQNYDAAYVALKSDPNPNSDLRAALQKIAYFRGVEAFAQGDLAGAQALLAESAAVGISPKYNALVLFWQGEIAYAEDDFSTAVKHYNAYLTRAPRTADEYAMAYYNLGYGYFSQGRMSDAKQAFAKFLSLRDVVDSYRADAWNRLGDTHFAERAFDSAIADFDKAIALGLPEKHYARYRRAVTLGLLHKVLPKIDALKQIVTEGVGDYVDDAAFELGHTYMAQEQYADGARVLERFVVDYPSSTLRAAALSDLGLSYLNLGDREKSLKYYDQVVVAAPQSAEAKGAMDGIRDIYVSNGDVEGYFAYAQKMGLESDVSLVARDSLTFVAAQQLYLAQQHESAQRALKNYIDTYPKGYYKTDALYFLSDCYLRLNKREEAVATLTELAARGANSYTPAALERLAQMASDDRRYADAADAYRRLFDVAQSVAARNSAAMNYVRATLSEGDAAKITLMASDISSLPDAGAVALRESQFALAEQLRKTDRWREAVKIYRKLSGEVKSAEGAASAYYVVKDAFDAGDMAKTEKAAFAFIDKNSPQSYWLAKTYILLGDSYVARGDTFQARATYQSIADGYSPADDGIVAEAKGRITKLK